MPAAAPRPPVTWNVLPEATAIGCPLKGPTRTPLRRVAGQVERHDRRWATRSTRTTGWSAAPRPPCPAERRRGLRPATSTRPPCTRTSACRSPCPPRDAVDSVEFEAELHRGGAERGADRGAGDARRAGRRQVVQQDGYEGACRWLPFTSPRLRPRTLLSRSGRRPRPRCRPGRSPAIRPRPAGSNANPSVIRTPPVRWAAQYRRGAPGGSACEPSCAVRHGDDPRTSVSGSSHFPQGGRQLGQGRRCRDNQAGAALSLY